MKQNNRYSESGFTLFEIVIVMIISGFILSAFMAGYKVQKEKEKLEITQENIETLVSRIASAPCDDPLGMEDPDERSCYPCPARLDLGIDDPNFGEEVDCNNAAALPPLNTCANGICLVSGLGGANVVVGAVPFGAFASDDAAYEDELTISQHAYLKSIYDGWGRNYTYYVTSSMTDDPTFDKQQGAVNIVDENGTTLLEKELLSGRQYGAHFALVSHGEDGRGAYVNGSLHRPCGTAGVDGLDVENCAHLLGAPDANGTVLMGIRRRAPGAMYFDDIVSFRVSYDDDLWEYNYDTKSLYNLNDRFVGVNDNNPTDKLVIEEDLASGVESAIAVEQIQSSDYCVRGYRDENSSGVVDDDDRTCFSSDLIGSERDNCVTARAMTGISNNTKTCTDINFQNPAVIDGNPANSACSAAGTFVAEVNLDWGVVCN